MTNGPLTTGIPSVIVTTAKLFKMSISFTGFKIGGDVL